MMIKPKRKISKEEILTKISEEEIFNHYLEIYPEMGKQYTNPLRKDNSPGCTFFLKNGVLYFHDWSMG